LSPQAELPKTKMGKKREIQEFCHF
jgi:hypothetical protein